MRSAAVFSYNFDRLCMALGGRRDSTLAREIGVSREMVGRWRRGRSVPNGQKEELIAKSLNCTVADLWRPIPVEPGDAPAMLTLSQWAQREGIPYSRAKRLHDLKLLPGVIDGETTLVPFDLRAPEHSKHLVRFSLRPEWTKWFPVNLYTEMVRADVSVSMLAQRFGIRYDAVRSWCIGRGFPLQSRLPVIAEELGCTVEDLTSHEPTEDEFNAWSERYQSGEITVGMPRAQKQLSGPEPVELLS